MKKKLLSFFALVAVAIVTFATTQALQSARRAGAVAITIAAADITDGDISAAVDAKIAALAEGETVGNITITLDGAKTYTVSTALEMGAGTFTLNGNDAAITAEAPIVSLPTTPVVEANAEKNSFYELGAIAINNVKLTTSKSVVESNAKYLVSSITVNGSIVNQTADVPVFNFGGGAKGYPTALNVKNSTIWRSGSSTKPFFTSQSGNSPKDINDNVEGAAETQSISIENSTLFNIAVNKNFNELRQKGQKFLSFTIKNNIIVNSGKDNFLNGMNGNQNSTNPTWVVDGNSFGNIKDGDSYVASGTYKDLSSSQTGCGEVTNSITTDPKFKDAANGDFTLGESDQYKNKTGDPRWIVSVPKAITVAPASGDINVAITAEAAKLAYNEVPSDITINLTKDAAYKVTAPIEAAASVVINGAEGAKIDASANEGALIKMSNTPSVDILNDCYFVDKIVIKDVTINDIKSFLVDNSTSLRYVVKDLTVDNAIAKLSTSAEIDALIRLNSNQSGVKDLTIKNSTFYQTGESNPKYFIQYSQGDPARWKLADEETWSFNYYNNTFYKVTSDNWANTSRTNNVKARTIFNVEKNIFVDCGNGQTAQRMLNQQTGHKTVNFVSNTYWKDGKAVDQSNYDKSGTALTTDPSFDAEKVAAGDFTVFAGSQQAKEKTGDPRWLVEYDADQALPVDITVAPEAGADIATAVTTAKSTVDKAGNITINLAKDGAYKVTAPIEGSASIVLNGAEGATIDASGNEGAFIQLSATPSVDFLKDVDGKNTSYYGVDNITIKNVKVTGIKNSIFYDNNKTYCVVNFTIDNAVMQLATEAVKNEALISFEGGGAKDFTIKNSTIYGNGAVAKYFAHYNNSARIDRFGYNESGKYEPNKTTVTYANNTFYKVATGNWANYSGINNGTTYDVQKNIWVDCGDGEIARRLMGNSRLGSGATATWSKNTYWTAGARKDQGSNDTGTGEDAALVTNPTFDAEKVAAGDFTIGASTQQAKEKTGDPRWLVEYVKAELDKTALTAEITAATTLLGETATDADPGKALSDAIAAATATSTSETVEFQDEIDAAVAALQAAEKAFAAAQLTAEITAATTLLGDAETTADPGKALSDAIAAATAVKDKADATVAELTKALADLKDAEEAYKVATGIRGINVDGAADIFSDGKPVYNLAGQRVFKGYKGIVIKNGRKYVVK